MKKTIYLLSNAHLDPVWQWEWEEGAAAALSTFRCAADFCEEFDGYIFNHNEALLYRWVEEYEPALFERIRRLVKEGKWHIMGGWHLQPDCNLPSGEAFVRQILAGRLYFAEKFGVKPTTAINFDPFGHSRGLVQILAKSGFDSYLFCRPDENHVHLPEGPFCWVGYDGSTVMAQRLPDYGSALGKAAEKIKGYVYGRSADKTIDACLWGVGDHGGGPSRKDLRDIAALKAELEKQDIVLLHATPEDFFARVKKENLVLENHAGDLNLWAPGCYTSQIRLKQKYRQIENDLFETEKMLADACAQDALTWPAAELDAVAYDMLTAQFHDFLPGSSIQPVEEMALRTLDHGLEILSRLRGRAFFALASGQPVAEPDNIPILIYNPHPFAVEGDFECEMMLADQNFEASFSLPSVWQNGGKLPTQCEKENSNLPIDWRKRVVFHATLAPMQMNRFDCRYQRIAARPIPTLAGDDAQFVFESAGMKACISKQTGLLTKYEVNGKNRLAGGAFALEVMHDNADPWGMTVESFDEKIGEFCLMSAEECTAMCGVDSLIPAVRVIEDGEVRTTVEAAFRYQNSRAIVRYTLSKTAPEITVEVRVQWAEVHKMLKLRIPTAMKAPACHAQVAFGEETLAMTGRENIMQKYVLLEDGTDAVSLLNNCCYGVSGHDGTLLISLLRSPAYTAHPIDDRKIIMQDRYTPHIEQGERLYHFALCAGSAEEIRARVARRADVFNEKPMALSFFPSGAESESFTPAPLFTLSDGPIQLSAVKQAADGKGMIVRLFNPTGQSCTATLTGRLLHKPLTVSFGAFEVVTLRMENGSSAPCDLMENALKK